MSPEPKVTVTEGDRRAAVVGYHGPEAIFRPRNAHWIETGGDDIDAIAPEIADVIARVRTMAAFDERVSCAFKLAQVCDEIQLSVVVGVAVDADQGPDMLTRDDIRALVLAGWEGTT